MQLCNLHRYLYASADRHYRVRWQPVQWGEDLGLHPEEVEALVEQLIEAQQAWRRAEYLYLAPWTVGTSRKDSLLSKGEQLRETVQEHMPLVSPHYRHLDSRKSRRKPVTKDRVLDGIDWEGVDRDYRLFIEAFPVRKLRPWSVHHAWPYWEKLLRHGELPALGVLLHYLKVKPPQKPYNTPLTWLKQHFWTDKRPDPDNLCPSCAGEGVVYGTKPDGTKGAVPCELCKGKGTFKIFRRFRQKAKKK